MREDQRAVIAEPDFIEMRSHRRFELSRTRRIVLLDEEARHIFAIGNLSTHGLAGTCDHPLQIGRHYRFCFENGEGRTGEVRWASAGRFGIYFRLPLGPELLRGAVRAVMIPRSPRFETRRPAVICRAGTRRPAIVRNVSTTGMLLETVMTLSPGERIEVECGTLAVACDVRWSRDVHAGVRFDRPIALETFERSSLPGQVARAAAV